jgi:hypothetical protein
MAGDQSDPCPDPALTLLNPSEADFLNGSPFRASKATPEVSLRASKATPEGGWALTQAESDP